jgi:predicted phosphodiesterase
MTLWGLLSDIHGNLPALMSALGTCRSEGASRIAVLGDNLGRGDSDACVAVIQDVADVSVLGNRDLDWADRVGSAARDYVLSLPRLARTDDFIATHGDHRLDRELSSSEIKTGFRRAQVRLAREHARVWLFGHTHRARVWRLSWPEGAPDLLFDAALDALPATVPVLLDEPGVRWAINVGSVGLPFPGKGPASLAIYDSEAGALTFLAVQAWRESRPGEE